MNLDDYSTLRDRHLVGETIEFSKHSGIHGAQDCSFEDCRILLDPRGMPAFRGGGRHWFARVEFRDCAITAPARIHDLDLGNRVRLERCRLLGGPYTEPKFGPGVRVTSDERNWVSECDFRTADLRDARLYRTPFETVQAQGWPYITVVAKEGATEYAQTSAVRPALTVLVDAVSEYAWEDRQMARAMEILVFAVGLRTHEATIKISHAGDVVRRGAGSLERLKQALERFAHPAIKY